MKGYKIIDAHSKWWSCLIAGLLTCSSMASLPAQNGPAYTLHAQSNLTLIDLTAVDHSTFVPDKTLTRDDLQVFDNGHPPQ